MVTALGFLNICALAAITWTSNPIQLYIGNEKVYQIYKCVQSGGFFIDKNRVPSIIDDFLYTAVLHIW